MLKSKLILFFLFCCFTVTLRAQDIYFSNYPQHQFFYNPAFAGVDSTHDFSLTGRHDNFFFNNIPTYSTVLTYNQPICHFKSGIGAAIAYRTDVYSKEIQSSLAYNYKIKLTKKKNIRLGVSSSLYFNKFYNSINNTGALEIQKIYLDVDAGLRYEIKNFFIGVSHKNIFNQKVLDLLNSPNHNYRFSLNTFTVGSKFNINKSFSTAPSFLYMNQMHSHYLQIANDVSYKKTFLLGAGLIFKEAFTVRGGISLCNKFQAMLSYDLNISSLHESSNRRSPYEVNIQYYF